MIFSHVLSVDQLLELNKHALEFRIKLLLASGDVGPYIVSGIVLSNETGTYVLYNQFVGELARPYGRSGDDIYETVVMAGPSSVYEEFTSGKISSITLECEPNHAFHMSPKKIMEVDENGKAQSFSIEGLKVAKFASSASVYEYVYECVFSTASGYWRLQMSKVSPECFSFDPAQHGIVLD
jgi:hypothetical protein